jgi:hypothetical protein
MIAIQEILSLLYSVLLTVLPELSQMKREAA